MLVSASLVWGLALSTRLLGSKPPPAWLLDLHRALGGLAVIFTGVHLAGLVGDTYVHFGPAQLFVPLASRWHPVAVAWGVVGLYFLIAIELTSLAMRRLPKRFWRRIHHTSAVLYVVATVHMFAAGTDRHNAALQVAALASVAMVLFLTIVRVLSPRAVLIAKRREARGRIVEHRPVPRAPVRSDA